MYTFYNLTLPLKPDLLAFDNLFQKENNKLSVFTFCHLLCPFVLLWFFINRQFFLPCSFLPKTFRKGTY